MEQTITLTNKKQTNNKHIVFIMILYLAGIFMGAIDTGIVTPARTLIQNGLGVDAKLGIWMITIYTLSYASSIPIMGKVADRFGRKYIYLLSIFLFGLGSLLSGLSQFAGSFTMLLIARAIQAFGGGGIMPVATAEFGTTFPKEKRGVALGLVGGIYGIANIFGASAGSLILDTFGHSNWSYIFFINIPITIFIIIFGIIYLPNSVKENRKRIDYFGTLFLTSMILSLLYGLRNIDFLNFGQSFTNSNVWLFLLLAVVIFPFFLYAEKKAEDPIINLGYFKNRQIVITLTLSFISGVILIGTIFIPQFSENALFIATGSGGYFVIVLGFAAGIGAPLSGKLIDKFGVKPILGFGFITSILAALFLIFIVIPNPTTLKVIVGLILMGLGMGFSLGTPLNYMMLENTDQKESNSALATVSLIRSIGTTIAPAIMVAFLASAGMQMQQNIASDLPDTLEVPPIEYSSEINSLLTNLEQDPRFQDQLSNFTFPDYSDGASISLDQSNMPSGGSLDPQILAKIQDSDVTTITNNTESFYSSIFDMFVPQIVNGIQSGVDSGISSINDTKSGLTGAITIFNTTKTTFLQMKTELETLDPSAFDGTSVAELVSASTLAMTPDSSLSMLDGITTIDGLDGVIQSVSGRIQTMQSVVSMMDTLVNDLRAFKEDTPIEFQKAETNYLNTIHERSNRIEPTFQDTLNVGFKNIYLTTMSAAILGLVVLSFYKKTEHKIDSKTIH